MIFRSVPFEQEDCAPEASFLDGGRTMSSYQADYDEVFGAETFLPGPGALEQRSTS